jgi:hypothetical protein
MGSVFGPIRFLLPCRGQVHGAWKERRINIRIIIIIIRNGAKTTR